MKQTKFLLIVGDGPAGCVWCEIDWDEFQYCDDQPTLYDVFVFDGKEAKIFVASYRIEDQPVDRQKALKTASLFVLGQFDQIVLNPEGFDPFKRKGEALIHPPY